jgi:outer membrane protein TolC
MKKIFFVTIFFVLLTSATANAGDDAVLDKLLGMAATNNPKISAARERIRQARAGVGNAASQMRPSLVTNAYGRLTDEPGNQGREVYSASLSLVQTLYAGGTLKANKAAAELAVLAAKAESVRTYQETLNSVREYYYETLRADALLNVAEESLNMSKEHLKQTEALYMGGMAPKGDVLRVKVSVSQAEQERVSAEGNLHASLAAHDRAVGQKIQKSDIIPETTGSDKDDPLPPSYSVYEDIVKEALSKRPEITAYEFYGSRANELLKAAKGRRLPEITISGNLSATGSDNYYGWQNDDTMYVQLGLQWTLFDGGAAASEVDRLKASARELLKELENLNAQIRQEAVQAQIRLDSAKKRFDVAGNQAEDAREDYRLALRRYDAQVGTNLDVLDSRAALIESRTALVNAVYDIAAARCGMIFAGGEDVPGEGMFE